MENNFSFKQAICFEYIVRNINPNLRVVWILDNRLVCFDLLPTDDQNNMIVYSAYSDSDTDYQYANSNELLSETLQKYRQNGGCDKFTHQYAFRNNPDMLLRNIYEFIQSNSADIESINFDGRQTLYKFNDLYSKVKLPFRIYSESDKLRPISLLESSQNQIGISKDCKRIEDLHMLVHMSDLLFL